MVEENSYPPDGGILDSYVNDRLDWKGALGELIDNAIDANAQQITIHIGPEKRGVPEWVSVVDDGDGCPNPIDMVRLGRHTNHKTTKLGRFGIGAKNAMLWLGSADSTVTISTSHGETRRSLALPWREYAEGGRWCIDSSWSDEFPNPPGMRGTQIHIKPCIRGFRGDAFLKKLVKDLGYLYAPAILKQRQIQIRRHKHDPVIVESWQMPALVDVVEATVEVGKRTARLKVGMVPDGVSNSKPGLTYTHGFRVIKPSCGLGCGGFDHSGICGWVSLDRAWDLTKNKDDIAQHQDELGDAVFDVIRPLLERSEARGHALQSSQFNSEVDEFLNAQLASAEPDAKAKRGRGSSRGTKNPTGKGGKHKRARNEQPGETFTSRIRRGSLRVSFRDLGDGEEFGQHSEGTVILNLGNPFIQRLKSSKNVEAVSLAAAFVFLDSWHSFGPGGQRQIRFSSTGDMAKDMGRLFARAPSMDGKVLRAVDDRGEAAE